MLTRSVVARTHHCQDGMFSDANDELDVDHFEKVSQ